MAAESRKTLLKNCRLFKEPDKKVSVVFDGKILFAGPESPASNFVSADDGHLETDCEGKILVPGFIDIHNHGGGGFDFAVADEDGFKTALLAHLRCGTTTILPTAASASNDALLKMFDTYRNVLKSFPGNCLGGIHLEGPYLNPNKKGAMPPHLLALPLPENYEILLDRGEDIIKRFTVAPELPGAFEFGDLLAKKGILLSAGHSEASSALLKDSKNHGFSLGTHIYNAMTSMHKEGIFRRTGVAEALLSDSDFDIEAISDGIHVPPDTLNICWRLKGTSKMCLITDSISAAGCNIKSGEQFQFVDKYILIEDGVAKLPDRSAVAGSIGCGISMLKAALASGIPFHDAIIMMTETPARICGFSDLGRIEPGFRADLVLLDPDSYDVSGVYKDGVEVEL